MHCSNLIPAQCLCRVLALHHRHDPERHQIRPAGYPALQHRDVVRFHQLEAAAEVGCHPAAYELQSIWHHASLFAQAAIDRPGVLIAESFNDHEHHLAASPTAGPRLTVGWVELSRDPTLTSHASYLLGLARARPNLQSPLRHVRCREEELPNRRAPAAAADRPRRSLLPARSI